MHNSWSSARWLVVALLLVPGWLLKTQAIAPNGPSADIVISQIYGGGGNAGATLTNDFIELYNRGSSSVSVNGWSVQYASSAGGTWQVTQLTNVVILPGQYYLIQEAAGAGGTTPLPTPNASGNIPMSATSGKVALVTTTTPLTGTCPTQNVRDLVGYGSAANCSEISPTANLTNTTAALRGGNGATDTDNNNTDFSVGTPNPRNAAPPDTAPAVTSTVPASGASGVALAANLSVTFSEPVTVSGAWFTLSCSISGVHGASTSGGPTTFTLDPDVDFVPGDSCTLTIVAAQIADVDTLDPPNAMAVNATTTFSTGNACQAPYTSIPSIQGELDTAATTGIVTTLGVVIGDYEGASPALQGFYLQDPVGDGKTETSDGIFVFNGNNNRVALGDVVRVTGTASEFQGQTQISSVTSIVACGTGTVAPVDVIFPVESPTALERYEGMLVRLPQTMYVTELFQLGRFGQVTLSADARLPQPTNVATPGASALALQAQNDLNRIILDDSVQSQNPEPIVFGRRGNPLSAANTLRGGDTAAGIVGVMTFTWAGNAASGNAYRVRPFNALGGSAEFQPTNARPSAAPAVGGSVRAVGMNLLNFFNTFADGNASTPGCYPSGQDSDCRGASNATEFARQWPKTVAAILALKPDVLGVNEIENDGYGPASALQFLVDRLNAATAPGTYDFIDADAQTGEANVMGTDAIRVALLYKPAVLTPAGQTAVLNTADFVNGGDPGPRSRPSLAQAFRVNSSGAVFVVDVNHLKSKGSACSAPDAGDGQGNCAAVRVNAATALTNWLATDPTGTGDPDILLLGDYNSYAMEDPIAAIENAGFTNLITSYLGPDAYSYAFDGQWGYLDHALGSAALVPQVTGVADYHVNADEPTVLDYLTDFKSANQLTTLYAADQFRMSDHDPVLVGLAPKGFSITYGGFALSRATGRWLQSVTIKNDSASAATGPISLVLTALSSNATLFGATGTTTVSNPGTPYKNLTVASLAPGASATIALEFTKTGTAAIAYVGQVIAGPDVR